MIIHKCKTTTTIIHPRFSLVLQRLMVQEFPLLISQLMRRLIKILLPTLSKNMKQLLMLFKTIPTLGLNLQHAWSDLLVMISWTLELIIRAHPGELTGAWLSLIQIILDCLIAY